MNENPAYKSGFATLIGRPNVGKSTLMNRLIGQKIAITSNKPQTTRNRIQTVYTCKDGQIVFLDTPGIHKAKNKLGEYMVQVAERTLKDLTAFAAYQKQETRFPDIPDPAPVRVQALSRRRLLPARERPPLRNGRRRCLPRQPQGF